MSNITIGIRHGDIGFFRISELPKGLKASKTKTLIQNGSSGNPHTFSGGVFYPHLEGDFILGYLKAKGTKLFHVEHSPKGGKIEDGLYEVRKQVEITHEGMKPIID